MMQIKAGVLSAAVIAQARHPEKDVLILPITISYERLPELAYLNLLQKGKNLRNDKNSLFKRIIGHFYYFGSDAVAFTRLWCLRKLGAKQGAIFVDYDMPIPVHKLVDLKANFHPNQKDELFAHKKSMQILAAKIHEKLQSLFRLLPIHLTAYAIKQKPTSGIGEIRESVRAITAELSCQNRNMKSLNPLSIDQVVEYGISQLTFFKAVSKKGDSLQINNQSIVDYYASAIASAVAPFYIFSKDRLQLAGQSNQRGGFNMPFQDYLKIPFIVDLKATEKADAFKELVKALCKATKAAHKQKVILEEMLKREESASTFIGQGLAIPHIRMNVKDDFSIVVGRSVSGIKYDAARGALAYIIVLVITNEKTDNGLHIQMLNEIATFFKSDTVRNQVLATTEGTHDLAAIIAPANSLGARR